MCSLQPSHVFCSDGFPLCSQAKVINMLNHLWEAVDVFEDPGVERIMKSDILTVHTGYNGRGLARAMVEVPRPCTD